MANFFPGRRSLVFALSLLCQPLFAQHVEPIGVEGNLNIATWNIEWFGHGSGQQDSDVQFANVRAIIEQSGIDVWAVQEIANRSQFNRLLDSLGVEFNGFIRDNCVATDQRIGYIYRTSVVTNRGSQQLFRGVADDKCYEFAQRPPIRFDTQVMLPDTALEITFIAVHMKAFGDNESYNRRVAASGALKDYIDNQRVLGLLTSPVILLGDFNDFLLRSTNSTSPSPYENFLMDSDGYYSPTRVLEANNKWSYCGNDACTSGSSMIDHILITRDLFPYYVLDSSDHYLQLTDAFPPYRVTTSDHLPVYAQFEFRTISRTDADELIAGQFRISGAFPNPFFHATTIELGLDDVSRTRVDVFDMMGRRVERLTDDVLPAGHHVITIDGARLSPGMYLVRVMTEAQISAIPVVLAR